MKVVTLVGRQQGLIVPRGNPKGDLLPCKIWPARMCATSTASAEQAPGCCWIIICNRLGIDPQKIRGYPVEEYTHLGVAVAVASGRADCGLGIAAAAQALELDFIPLYEERYDLVVPDQYYNSESVSPVMEHSYSRRTSGGQWLPCPDIRLSRWANLSPGEVFDDPGIGG